MVDRHREAFESFARQALENFDSVKSVTLFGSVARGSHGSMSDVDVLVEVESLEELEEIEELAFRKASEFGVAVSPIVKETGEIEGSPLSEEIGKGESVVRS